MRCAACSRWSVSPTWPASKIKALSGGMCRRVALAQALLGSPDLLVLDEPTAGLDPEQRLRFHEVISAVATDATVILSTHQTEDVSAVCQRVVVMHEGLVRYDGSRPGTGRRGSGTGVAGGRAPPHGPPVVAHRRRPPPQHRRRPAGRRTGRADGRGRLPPAGRPGRPGRSGMSTVVAPGPPVEGATTTEPTAGSHGRLGGGAVVRALGVRGEAKRLLRHPSFLIGRGPDRRPPPGRGLTRTFCPRSTGRPWSPWPSSAGPP